MSKNSKEDKLVLEELERKRKKAREKEARKNGKAKESIKANPKIEEGKNKNSKKKQAETENKVQSIKQNNELMKATIFFAMIFFAMVGYYAYIITVDSELIINNSYNSRLEKYAEINVRGSIYTRDGTEIACTETDNNGKEKRLYPYDNLFVHVVGINSHGKSGIEKAYDYHLLTTNINPILRVVNEFKGEKNIGNDIVTTLDLKLQQAAYDSLGSYDGAAVVLDNKTGEILAMVSKPDYNPNKLEKALKEIETKEKKSKDNKDSGDKEQNNGNESFLVNRATQGLYTPGSVFKIFTALEFIRQDKKYEDFMYNCKGSDIFANYEIHCYNKTKHKEESIVDAFANSCNGAFATIATELDQDKFRKNMNALLFNEKLPIVLEYSKSSFNISNKSSTFDITQSAIGQGTILMTPIHMAMIVQAIANDGMMMVPYVVSEIDGYNGSVIESFEPEEYGIVMTKSEAKALQKMMSAVTREGTGKIMSKAKYSSGGKTGTAQIDSEDNVNSWFVGYANKGNKDVTICVVIENVPDGSIKAVECAKDILDEYFK